MVICCHARGDYLKRCKVQKAVSAIILAVFLSSSLVCAAAYSRAGTQTTLAALGTAASFGVFGGGAGMTNQGIYIVVNGDIGSTAVSTLVTGYHDKVAVFTETQPG